MRSSIPIKKSFSYSAGIQKKVHLYYTGKDISKGIKYGYLSYSKGGNPSEWMSPHGSKQQYKDVFF